MRKLSDNKGLGTLEILLIIGFVICLAAVLKAWLL